mmetsp:Transcript_81931/g.244328  ORF Transcript_81931/g.244328 Transcript_81931/m.244328 type:complete len:208 (+) Transcript_81931:174-797(+)
MTKERCRDASASRSRSRACLQAISMDWNRSCANASGNVRVRESRWLILSAMLAVCCRYSSSGTSSGPTVSLPARPAARSTTLSSRANRAGGLASDQRTLTRVPSISYLPGASLRSVSEDAALRSKRSSVRASSTSTQSRVSGRYVSAENVAVRNPNLESGLTLATGFRGSENVETPLPPRPNSASRPLGGGIGSCATSPFRLAQGRV